MRETHKTQKSGSHINFPDLQLDDTYYMREQMLADAQDFLNYYNTPEVSQYILATIPSNLSQAEDELNYCRQLFYKSQGLYWAIALQSTNQMIGSVGLDLNLQNYKAEICYDLDQVYWNQKIMSKALHAAITLAFERLQLKRIEAVILKDNLASAKLLTKLGFQHEGTLRNYRYFNNAHHTIELYALIPDDFR